MIEPADTVSQEQSGGNITLTQAGLVCLDFLEIIQSVDRLDLTGGLAFVIHTNLQLQLHFAVLEGFFLQLLLMTCNEGALKYDYEIYYQI